MRRSTLSACVVVLLCGSARLVWADDANAAQNDKLPRYRLEVGQELNYEETSSFNYTRGFLNNRLRWKLLVVKKEQDGRLILLVRYARASSQTKTEEEAVEFNRESSRLGRIEMLPNGSIVETPDADILLDVDAVLPRLPDRLDQKSWTSDQVAAGTHHVFSLDRDSSEAGQLNFIDEAHTIFDEIYLSSKTRWFSFDLERGLVDRARAETTQGYGFTGKGEGKATLASVEKHDASECAGIYTQLDAYLSAKRQYDRLLTDAEKSPDHADSMIASAKEKLDGLKAETTNVLVREQLDQDLESHEGTAKYYRETADRFAKVLGKTSEEWEALALDGTTHSISEFRGKVVVLDFWYRGCGWCIRAMPQMKQVAAHYQDRPVAILGMNTDRDEENAKFVVDKLKLNYLNIKAEGLPEKYGVRGFPTLVLIDRDGVVRDVHIGWSSNLFEKLTKSIDGLLAETPTPAAE
ncbi:MAG TPA: TlpA disulfide reductase family protein [Pirellulales bacterium]